MSEPWSLLVYIAADNPLYVDAQVSLQQIVQASQFAHIRILVQFDGPSAEFASRYKCANGTKTLIWEAPDGYTPDRGKRLADFLDFAIDEGFAGESSPEDDSPHAKGRIFLVLWGHGAGLDHVYLYSDPQDKLLPDSAGPKSGRAKPARGNAASAGTRQVSEFSVPRSIPFDLLNSDNAHANRYLNDMRLADILSGFSAKLGRRIDLLGFDACLMGMAEICHEISSSVSLVVASDEELPKGSWPYDTILQDLTHFPGMDANTLSAVIVSRFIERYAMEGKRTRISLSTYRLSACKPFAVAMKGLVEALTQVLDVGVARRKILHSRDFSRTPDVPDYIDLGVFCKEIAASFQLSSPAHRWANEVLKLLVGLPYILYHRDAGENGTIDPLGLAIYFPQVLPPTSAELSTAISAGGALRTYHAMAPAHTHKVPAGMHIYRPAQGAAAMTILDHTKTLLHHTKTILDHTKTVLDHWKTINGHMKRAAASGRVVPRELVGSEVIWDLYLELKFNKETQWGNLVEALINGKPVAANAK